MLVDDMLSLRNF